MGNGNQSLRLAADAAAEAPIGAKQATALRRDRGGSRSMRWFGVLLLTVAASMALDPDYPVPRELYLAAVHSSAPPALPPESVPLPVAVHPVGGSIARRPRFLWDYRGPPAGFEFVLLDEGLDEVYRTPVTSRWLVADDALLAVMGDGGQFHWFVEGSRAGRTFRSAPAAFAFCR